MLSATLKSDPARNGLRKGLPAEGKLQRGGGLALLADPEAISIGRSRGINGHSESKKDASDSMKSRGVDGMDTL